MYMCEVIGCSNRARGIGGGKRGRLCSTHHRQRYPRNKARSRRVNNRQRLRRYGMTPADKAAMLREQESVCAICGLDVDVLCVDHCHSTGIVRGLLCHKCNWGLGMFDDDLDLLAAATSYLVNSRLRSCG